MSRTHPGFLQRLFELEVPEIYDGTVELKSITREAGGRSKVAVASNDENVDAVGACVGQKGSRIQPIVAELNGEKIDVIQWERDSSKLVANALSPAKVLSVTLSDDGKNAQVVVPDDQLSLATEGRAAQDCCCLQERKLTCSDSDMMHLLHAERDEDETAEEENMDEE